MAHAIAIPKLGLTMTDCTLVSWAKEDGEQVAKGEILYSIETEKITSDIEAEIDGYVQRLAAPESMHQVGAVVGRLHGTREEALAGDGAAKVNVPQASTRRSVTVPQASSAPTGTDNQASRRQRVSPLARRIAAAAGVDTTTLTGTGAGGAVLRRDIETEIARRAASRPANPSITSSLPTSAASEPLRRPLTGMRKTIARNMIQSLHTTAQMTGFGRVDMGEVVKLREACVAAQAELGVRISFTDIVLKAVASVLADMPEINSSIIGDDIVTWSDVNIGMAVALDEGLIVPVIHNADRKSLVTIAHERLDLAARARAGQLGRGDLEGGTFSLSNFGSYGGDFETPLLNPPQSALLGIGGIADEPVVREGQIVIRPMMMLSLTVDHRLIDGAVAGRFRSRLKTLLERPYSMMARMR